MNVLITGAGGFLGGFLARNIIDHTITALTHGELDLCDDAALNAAVERYQPQWIINCAALGRDRPRDLDLQILTGNLTIYQNLLSVSHKVTGIINFGTGAEFGITRPVCQAREQDIWQHLPDHSYGMSKNIISRMSSVESNLWCLRLWGCCDASESSARPFARLAACAVTGDRMQISQDRLFDWFSAADVAKTVQHVMAHQPDPRDFNLVYQEKLLLSEAMAMFCSIHGIDPKIIEIGPEPGLEYTGDPQRLDSLDIDLLGLHDCLSHYKVSTS